MPFFGHPRSDEERLKADRDRLRAALKKLLKEVDTQAMRRSLCPGAFPFKAVAQARKAIESSENDPRDL